MPDPRNTDFLRHHARVAQRVSNIETGVHPVKADVAYEDVGAPVEGGDVDLTGYIHYGDNASTNHLEIAGQYLNLGTTGQTPNGYGTEFSGTGYSQSIVGINVADADGVALKVQGLAPLGGSGIIAQTYNGVAVFARAETGTGLWVEVGSGTALNVVGPAIFNSGVTITGNLTINGSLTVTGPMTLNGQPVWTDSYHPGVP